MTNSPYEVADNPGLESRNDAFDLLLAKLGSCSLVSHPDYIDSDDGWVRVGIWHDVEADETDTDLKSAKAAFIRHLEALIEYVRDM